MDFDGISGLESEFIYNGLLLNQRSATATNYTRYKITEIGGFDDADVRDAREMNPARDGELAMPAYYGGRTITFTGKILANNVRELRQMQQNLRSAFASLSEQPLTIDNGNDTFQTIIDASLGGVWIGQDSSTTGYFEYRTPTNSPLVAVGQTLDFNSIVMSGASQNPNFSVTITNLDPVTYGGGQYVHVAYYNLNYPTTFYQSVVSGLIGTSTTKLVYINARKSAPIQMRESQQGQYPTRDFMVTLRASDPRFYSSATNSVTRTGSQLATSFSLVNDGNANSDPVIKITGPLVATSGGANPEFLVANATSGQALGFRFPVAGMATSTSIAVIDSSTRSISGSLAYSNVLSNSVFPSVIGGTNTFVVSGLTGTGNVQVIYKNSWI